MNRIRKMREKNKGKKLFEVFISNKIMDYAKKLENNIQKRESLKETDGINLNIQYEKRFDINTKKIYKFNKKNLIKKYFPMIINSIKWNQKMMIKLEKKSRKKPQNSRTI